MNRSTGIIDKKVFARFADEAVALGLQEIGLYSTGEPFIVKNLSWYVKRAKEAGLRRVYVTSNGALATLDRVIELVYSGLDSIKFSINAATRESYKLTHGSDDFNTVLYNIQNIFDWKNTTDSKLQLLGSCIYTKLTKNEIDLHKAIFSKYFDDILYLQAKSQGGHVSERIRQLIEQYNFVNPAQIKPCEMLWNRIHMTWEGYLSACCADYELDLTYADYKSGLPLMELWNNVTMQRLRQHHLDGQLDNLICKSCLLGQKFPYSSISDMRGKSSKQGKAENDTMIRIQIAAKLISDQCTDLLT